MLALMAFVRFVGCGDAAVDRMTSTMFRLTAAQTSGHDVPFANGARDFFRFRDDNFATLYDFALGCWSFDSVCRCHAG